MVPVVFQWFQKFSEFLSIVCQKKTDSISFGVQANQELVRLTAATVQQTPVANWMIVCQTIAHQDTLPLAGSRCRFLVSIVQRHNVKHPKAFKRMPNERNAQSVHPSQFFIQQARTEMITRSLQELMSLLMMKMRRTVCSLRPSDGVFTKFTADLSVVTLSDKWSAITNCQWASSWWHLPSARLSPTRMHH